MFITHKILMKKASGDFNEPEVFHYDFPGPDTEYGDIPGEFRGFGPNGIQRSKHPEQWANLENHLKTKNPHGANFDLQKFVDAHVPKIGGVNHELRLDNRENTTYGQRLGFNYTGRNPQTHRRAFTYDGVYPENGDELHIGLMRNSDAQKNGSISTHLPKLLSQLSPYLHENSIKRIRTDAASYQSDYNDPDDNMNGAHTWAKLGFGFDPERKPYDEFESDDYNPLEHPKSRMNSNLDYAVANLRRTHPELPGYTPHLADRIKALKYPGEIRNVLTDAGYGKYAAQLARETLNNVTYPAVLNIDPKDPGYQRAMNYINIINKKNQMRPKLASLNEEHIHKGHLKEVFPWLTDEEEHELLLLEDALWEKHKRENNTTI